MTEEAAVQETTGAILASSAELRALVLDLWQRIRIDWSYASDQLSKSFRANKSLSGDSRRAVAETLYAMIRQLRRLDFALSLGGRPSDRERDALRLWATLILEFGVAPERAKIASAAIDWQKVANVADVIDGERNQTTRVGLAASLPEWLAEMLVSQYGDRALPLAMALSKRAPMTVRANTLKGDADALAAELTESGFATSRGEYAENALVFETRTNIFGLAGFKRGLFEAQDEGSQLIAELVAPPPKAKVVDYCAGAGGKTLALSALMENRGRIIAADVNARKLAELRRRAKRAGAGNIFATELSDEPLASLPKPLEAWRMKADRVLVDAPCTGVGALRRNPEIRWRLGPGDPARLAKLQLDILENAYELVKPGGRLIYATCSVLRSENQDVVASFLERHSDALTFAPKEIWGRAKATPLVDESERFMTLFPDVHGTDGFFVAILRRTPEA